MQRIRALIVRHIWWMVLVISATLLTVHSLGIHGITVDNTSLILLVLLLFSPFVAAVKKIKIGDFEAEIEPEEVRRVRRKVEESLPAPAPEDLTQPKTSGASSAINALAQSDAVIALAKLRIEFESQLRRLLQRANPEEHLSRPLPLTQVIRKLTAAQSFTPEFGSALRDVVAICNRAIHGEDIRNVDAQQIVSTGVELLEALEQMIRESGIADPVETTVIGTDERDAFQDAEYRMTTVVPYTTKPERHVYLLTQDQLTSFLEGYGEYAEFIVQLERLK